MCGTRCVFLLLSVYRKTFFSNHADADLHVTLLVKRKFYKKKRLSKVKEKLLHISSFPFLCKIEQKINCLVMFLTVFEKREIREILA